MEDKVCARCELPAKYQCLKDEEYTCSDHCREYHLRHKFQSISQEFAYRSALLSLFQRDLSVLSEGLGFDRHFSEKCERKADEVTADFVEAFEQWVEVHRKQLEELKKLAEEEDGSELMKALIARLQSNYAKPLLKFRIEVNPSQDAA